MQEETKGLEETKETAKDIMNDLMVEIIKHSRSTAINDAIKVLPQELIVMPISELKGKILTDYGINQLKYHGRNDYRSQTIQALEKLK